MVILHFACIDNTKTTGVCVAVRQHVQAQSRFAEAALVNVNAVALEDLPQQLPLEGRFALAKLPQPFDRPDLAVFHECYRPAYLYIAGELRRAGVPYVIIPHGELREEAQRKKYLKKAVANLLLFNRFVNHALALQCLSADEEKMTRFGKETFIGTNGVDLPEKGKDRFREKGCVFLYIGRYEWRVKGLDLLFDAIRQQGSFLRKNGCRFELYGPDWNGRFDALLAMVRERQIGDLVTLHHEILGEEKRAALLDADVFIQTSRHEGMPMGILEAMSYGLPCLVTEGTSLAGEVADARAGWTAKTAAEAIGVQIVRAVSERARWSEYGANGAAAVQRRYAWNTVAAETVRQYQKLLSNNSKE